MGTIPALIAPRNAIGKSTVSSSASTMRCSASRPSAPIAPAALSARAASSPYVSAQRSSIKAGCFARAGRWRSIRSDAALYQSIDGSALPPRRCSVASIIMHTENRSRVIVQDDTGEAFLRTLGERVRELRARRGMTRRSLARESGVSERYLAQLEAGQGNPSILVIRHLARAFGILPEALVAENDPAPEGAGD